MSLSSLKATFASRTSALSTADGECQSMFRARTSTLTKLQNNATTFTDADLASYLTESSALVTKRIAMASALSAQKDSLSSIIAVQAVPLTGTPTNLVSTGQTLTTVSISFTNVSGATSNTITAVPTSGTTVTATFTSGSPYTLSGLSASTTYSITVTASNAFGTTGNSNAVSVTTTTPPSSGPQWYSLYVSLPGGATDTSAGGSINDYNHVQNMFTANNTNKTLARNGLTKGIIFPSGHQFTATTLKLIWALDMAGPVYVNDVDTGVTVTSAPGWGYPPVTTTITLPGPTLISSIRIGGLYPDSAIGVYQIYADDVAILDP